MGTNHGQRSVLFDVGPAKRDARWQWIMSFEPGNPADLEGTPRHSFWLTGYGNDKVKDDRIIEIMVTKFSIIMNSATLSGQSPLRLSLTLWGLLRLGILEDVIGTL